MKYYLIVEEYESRNLLILKGNKKPTSKELLYHLGEVYEYEYETLQDVKHLKIIEVPLREL